MPNDNSLNIDNLKNKKFLIVEDDRGLVNRLSTLFKQYGLIQPVKKHCIKGERYGGLDELIDNYHNYDVIIIDVRLPETEEELKKNDGYNKTLSVLQKEYIDLAELESTPEMSESLDKIKYQDAHLRNLIRENIQTRGGYDLIKEWLNCSGPNLLKNPLIVYLTSRVRRDVKELAIALYERSTWIEKPVRSKSLLSKISKKL